jgi:hypothetical protein
MPLTRWRYAGESANRPYTHKLIHRRPKSTNRCGPSNEPALSIEHRLSGPTFALEPRAFRFEPGSSLQRTRFVSHFLTPLFLRSDFPTLLGICSIFARMFPFPLFLSALRAVARAARYGQQHHWDDGE